MRVAIIADLHGNLIALDAVLQDMADARVDQTVCLGDVAGLGPQPRGVIDRLRSLACPVVMGNADEFLLDTALLDPGRHPNASPETHRLHEMERWCADQLTPADRAFIATFQPTVDLPLGDDASLLCYHGSPRSNVDEVRGETPDADLIALLGYRSALVLAGGHTHEQFVRRVDQRMVLNPGSVGLPYETLAGGGHRNPPWAEYAVLSADGERLAVELRRAPVDLGAVRAAILASGMPHAAWLATEWR
jgi:predicted phosphodiesterase